MIILENWAKPSKTDGQTDRPTEFLSLDCVCIPCSGVKMKVTLLLQVTQTS